MDQQLYEKQLRKLTDYETVVKEERVKNIKTYSLMFAMFVIGFVIGGLWGGTGMSNTGINISQLLYFSESVLKAFPNSKIKKWVSEDGYEDITLKTEVGLVEIKLHHKEVQAWQI